MSTLSKTARGARKSHETLANEIREAVEHFLQDPACCDRKCNAKAVFDGMYSLIQLALGVDDGRTE